MLQGKAISSLDELEQIPETVSFIHLTYEYEEKTMPTKSKSDRGKWDFGATISSLIKSMCVWVTNGYGKN